MTVKVSKPAINVREELADLRKPTGLAGEAMLRAETPQEQFNLIGAGRRNLIINGAMQVAQRGTSFTYSSGNNIYTTVDRFKQAYFGTWPSNHSEITQETDAPEGLLNSLKVKALVAQDYSSALGSWVQYQPENQDIISLQNGNGLKDFTVSLWLKASKTGNVTISVENSGAYSYSTYVTLTSASTWEYKTVTIPATSNDMSIDYSGDPSGGSLNFKVGLGSNGSWLVDTDDQWNDATSNRGTLSPQQTNFQATVNDYLQITGVCLNVGDSAIDFPHESYGDTLAKCQRYFHRSPTGVSYSYLGSGSAISSNSANVIYTLPVEMRSTPTFSTSGNFQLNSNVTNAVTTFTAGNATPYLVRMMPQGSSGNMTVGYSYDLRNVGDTSAYVQFDAEL